MSRLTIVYDGECPFCASYVTLLRLREQHEVELVDARRDRARATSYGLDLNAGMIADLDGEVFHGAPAMALLSRLSRGPRLMGSEAVAERVYPSLRGGRALALRLLGRKPL
jgi:predicted DCC family thiol-disulfide oxidoreductase YuxK